MNKCTYCQENKWDPDGKDLTPVFWKDSSGDPIHLKCYLHIEANPEDDNVRVWKMMGYLDNIDFIKTTEYTRETLQLLIMEKKGLTQEMVDSLLGGVNNA